MKHLKKFENFILPDHTETDDQDFIDYTKKMRAAKSQDDEDMDEVEADDDLSDEFSDIDDDLNERKKNSKKKAEECEEGDEDCAPVSKGLTAKQKKLPLALQKAILKRKK